jgi:hypothetical protein
MGSDEAKTGNNGTMGRPGSTVIKQDKKEKP